jgi:hypothetical protein
MQLIPLDDECGDEERARTARARQLCVARQIGWKMQACLGVREANQVRYSKVDASMMHSIEGLGASS